MLRSKTISGTFVSSVAQSATMAWGQIDQGQPDNQRPAEYLPRGGGGDVYEITATTLNGGQVRVIK